MWNQSLAILYMFLLRVEMVSNLCTFHYVLSTVCVKKLTLSNSNYRTNLTAQIALTECLGKNKRSCTHGTKLCGRHFVWCFHLRILIWRGVRAVKLLQYILADLNLKKFSFYTDCTCGH